MYYTVEMMNAEDFVARVEEDCRQRREAAASQNAIKQNRSPEALAQPVWDAPKTTEHENPI